MFILISFILIIPSVSLGIILPILKGMPYYYSIIFGIIGFLGAFALSILILIFSFLFKGLSVKNNKDPYNKKVWKFMNDGSDYVLFWMNVRIKKVGFEKLDKNEHYVFYSNHQSFLDILTFDKVLRDFPRGSLYKKEHDDNLFLGGFAKGLGGIAVDRKSPKKALVSIEQVEKVVNEGRNFMIYPEGTRSRDGLVHRYHPGSFKIGLNSNGKIAVILIDGLYHFYNYIPLIPKKFYVEILDVYDPKDLIDYNSVEFAEMVEEKVKRRLEEVRTNKLIKK